MSNDNIEETDEKTIVEGKAPNSEDEFLMDLRKQLSKDSLSVLITTLRQFITISSAFIAGTIAIYDKNLINQTICVVIILCFVATLIISIIGTLPMTKSYDYFNLTEVQNIYQSGLKYRLGFVRLSAMVFFLGIFFFLFGLLFCH